MRGKYCGVLPKHHTPYDLPFEGVIVFLLRSFKLEKGFCQKQKGISCVDNLDASRKVGISSVEAIIMINTFPVHPCKWALVDNINS